MEILFSDYKLGNEILNFSIHHNIFNGITGKDKGKIINIISLNHNYKGKIIINNNEIYKKDINFYKRKIRLIRDDITFNNFNGTVYELMKLEIIKRRISLKNESKKIFDSLKIVGLNNDILSVSINKISTSEKKLLLLALALLSNPDTIIFEEPMKYLDLTNEKKLIMLLRKIKEQYNKTFVFISDDSNMLYKCTNNLIIAKNNNILIEGNTSDIYQRVDFLKRNSIIIPDLVELTYLARKKKDIKIDYHKDIRDIIKDIYKHV